MTATSTNANLTNNYRTTSTKTILTNTNNITATSTIANLTNNYRTNCTKAILTNTNSITATITNNATLPT